MGEAELEKEIQAKSDAEDAIVVFKANSAEDYNEINELEEKLEEAGQTIAELERTNSELLNQNVLLGASLDEEKSVTAELKTKVEDLTQTYETLNKGHSEMILEFEAKTAQIQALQAQLEEQKNIT